MCEVFFAIFLSFPSNKTLSLILESRATKTSRHKSEFRSFARVVRGDEEKEERKKKKKLFHNVAEVENYVWLRSEIFHSIYVEIEKNEKVAGRQAGIGEWEGRWDRQLIFYVGSDKCASWEKKIIEEFPIEVARIFFLE